MKRIIVIEDDPAILDSLGIMLEEFGYQPELLSNGDSIFENEYEAPDLFIIDKQLSGADGLEICRYLKADEATHSIPVVMLSASPQISVLAGRAGADDFLEKPFTNKSLRIIIAKNIG